MLMRKYMKNPTFSTSYYSMRPLFLQEILKILSSLLLFPLSTRITLEVKLLGGVLLVLISVDNKNKIEKHGFQINFQTYAEAASLLMASRQQDAIALLAQAVKARTCVKLGIDFLNSIDRVSLEGSTKQQCVSSSTSTIPPMEINNGK